MKLETVNHIAKGYPRHPKLLFIYLETA